MPDASRDAHPRSTPCPCGSATCSRNADGGPLNLNGFSRREWRPAVEAARIARPARLSDLRSTFASNALARGITVYELARIMGTSIDMIERRYGALLDTAHDSLLKRLEAVQTT